MTDHPRHPDTDDRALAGPEPGAGTGSSRLGYGVVVIGVLLVVVIILLHLTGVVGPGAH